MPDSLWWLLWLPGIVLVAWQAFCALWLLTRVPPKPKTEPSTRLGQLAGQLRKPLKWLLLGVTGAVVSGVVGQAISATTNAQSAEAFERMARVLLLSVDVVLVYVAWVVGAAVWSAARDFQGQGRLADQLPRFALAVPGLLVMAWAAIAMSPAILIARIAERLSP